MAEFEIRCVSVDYSSQYDDCRAIETIGFNAVDGGFTRNTPEEIYRLLDETDHTVYVVYHGDRSTVRPATDGDIRYVRTEPTDTSEDVLLNQPSC